MRIKRKEKTQFREMARRRRQIERRQIRVGFVPRKNKRTR